MDKLRGVEALSVVCKRFSDGYEVVQCIIEFYKEMSEVEHSYAARILKLLGSANYTFHSNILMQWLGSDPFEEKGTVKQSWQKMGTELRKLATLHLEKAESFLDVVRQPLLDLVPQLIEDKKTLKQQKQEMENKLKNAERKLKRAKESYYRIGNTFEQCKTKKPGLAFTTRTPGEIERDFLAQEEKYTQAHRELVELQQSLNDEVDNLLKDIQKHELRRVNTISKSLQEFARTLSNTVPAYLEGMQRIIFSVDEVNGNSDIESFVMEHKNLQIEPRPPPLELHPCSSRDFDASKQDQPLEDQTTQEDLPSDLHASDDKPPPTLNRNTVPITRPKKLPKTTPTEEPTPTISQLIPNQTTLITNSDTSTSPPTTTPTITKPMTAPTFPKPTPTLSSSRPAPPPPSKALPTQRNRSESLEKIQQVKPSVIRTKPKSHTQVPPPPPPSTSIASSSQDSLFTQLKHSSKQNDYYNLLGVPPTANQEELSRARRELTSRLHPDHFNNDPIQQAKAQEKLVVVNQAYSDVLRNEVNREMYDQLVRYREKYHRILDQEGRALELAKTKLSSLRTSMRKARFPLPLLDELQIAIRLIEDKQEQAQQQT